MIAWKVVGKSKPQAQAAGVRLSDTRRPGGVAAMTQDTELTAMPRAGQVDMNDGLALAAMAASALEVPVSALLANSSVAGSAASVPSLDKTVVDMAIARQTKWIHFYERVFRALGIDKVTINFPKITEDPVHRQVSSLATARATGAIHADEYRQSILEATDVVPLHDKAPEVDEYAQAQNALGFMQLVMNLNASDNASDPLARQGNSGVSGRLGEIDNTNRNMDSAAGNGSQTDLVG